MKRGNGAFRALVEASARATDDGCINAGTKSRPRIRYGGRDMNASRAVWCIANGDPGELKVLHRCGNDQCLNIRCLYLGTTSDNANDTVLMDRCGNGVVPLEVAREIARRYQPGKAGNGNGNIAALSAEYGVSYAAIRLAARRVNRLNQLTKGVSSVLTIEDAVKTFGVEVDEHHERQAEIPVLAGLQFQGDVAVVPSSAHVVEAHTAVPKAGVPVVRGENGGNTHLLLAAGDGVRFDLASQQRGSLALGLLTVPAGASAYLAHPEHAYTGIAPGTYELRRQREQADEIRLVAD